MRFKVGAEVNLLCRIKLASTKSFAAAKWIRKDSKEILKTANFSYGENSKTLVHELPLVINHVSTDDAGYYTCVVNFDGHGSQNASYKLCVQGKWFLSRFFSLSLCAIFQSWVCSYLVLQQYLFCSSRLHACVHVASILHAAFRYSCFAPSLTALHVYYMFFYSSITHLFLVLDLSSMFNFFFCIICAEA